jgi:hypothetical protein
MSSHDRRGSLAFSDEKEKEIASIILSYVQYVEN